MANDQEPHKPDDALYRAMVRSQSRCKPNPRMSMFSRPAMQVQKQKRVWGTVGNVYTMFGTQRSTRRS